MYVIFPKIIYVSHLPEIVLTWALVWNEIKRAYKYTVVGGRRGKKIRRQGGGGESDFSSRGEKLFGKAGEEG